MSNFLSDLNPHLAEAARHRGSQTIETNPANTTFGTLTVRSSWAGVWADDNYTRQRIAEANADDLRQEVTDEPSQPALEACPPDDPPEPRGDGPPVTARRRKADFGSLPVPMNHPRALRFPGAVEDRPRPIEVDVVVARKRPRKRPVRCPRRDLNPMAGPLIEPHPSDRPRRHRRRT